MNEPKRSMTTEEILAAARGKKLLDMSANERARLKTLTTESLRAMIEQDDVAALQPHLPSLVNKKFKDDVMALHLAAELGKTEIMRLLLEQGADVNAPGYVHNAPLHAAAQAGQVEAARLLLERGARVDAENIAIELPLHLAAAGETPGHEKVVELLLAARANCRAVSHHGDTPLHNAATATTASRLLAAGADPNAQKPSDQSWTRILLAPLHNARNAAIASGHRRHPAQRTRRARAAAQGNRLCLKQRARRESHDGHFRVD